jgi:hypothetical protein
MYQTPFADRIRNEAGIATIAVGAISEADHVNSIIAAGRADLCAVARPHLANPAWTLHRGGAHRLDTIGRRRARSRDHSAVKLWLRLLACSTQIEQEIRSRLRERFGTTLPRFDYLAQLERHPEGLRMNALSRYLMVTGGNVTGLTDQLVAEGWVERLADPPTAAR